jgi:hypothetical protein
MKKKILAGMVAGAILAGTGFGFLGQAQAAADQGTNQQGKVAQHKLRGPQDGQPPMMNMNSADVAKRIHDTFGVNEAEVKAALDAKRNFHDVGQAAMLAKISGKSFKDVLAMKTDSKHWKDVGKELGITADQVKNQMDILSAERMAKRGDITKEKALSLLKAGYRPHDVGMAAKLAKLSKKDVQAVLDMKKINNTWRDVAKKLGVDESKLRPQFSGKNMQRHDKDGRGEMPGPAHDFVMGDDNK